VAFILSMAIFGSIGMLVRYLALPASEIAWIRGLLARIEPRIG